MCFCLVPAEIKKRGEVAVKGYIAALKKGKKKIPRCKLVILGEAGVGKTNLLNLLTGEKFVPTHEKTEGVDISLVNTFDIDTKTWKKTTGGGDSEYRKIAATEIANQLRDTKPDSKKNILPTPESLHQIFESVMKKYTKPLAHSKPKHATGTGHQETYSSVKRTVQHREDIAFNAKVQVSKQPTESEPKTQVQAKSLDVKLVEKKDVVHSINPQSTHVRSQGAVSTASSMPSSSSAQELNIVISDSRVGPVDAPSSGEHVYTMIFRLASRQRSSEPLILRLKFTSYDFAGQEHYKSMHPCFITYRAVYVVTFNARHLLGETKQKCIEEVNYWVNSILVHSNEDVKVILVGTHRGPYRGTSGFEALTDKQKIEINSVLKKFLRNKFVFSFFEGDKIMALVENSIENDEDDSGAKVIRKKLQSLGENHPGNKDDLPLSYLRLESKIFEERSKNQSFLVPRREVEQWANDFGIEDINVALDFFHDIGIIINPSKHLYNS